MSATAAELRENPVSAVGALTGLLTAQIPRSRSLGHVSDEAMGALDALQLTELSTPETGPHSVGTQCEVVAALSALDPAMGALTALRLATPPMVIALGDQAWHTVRDSAVPAVTVAFSSAGPAAQAVPARGGWQVRGRWHCPGHHRAGWILVPVRSRAGAELMLMVERERFTIEPRAAAARAFPGLGSNPITLTDVLVPEGRALRLDALFEGEHGAPRSLAARPEYGQPLVPRLCALTAAVAAGMARNLLEQITTGSHGRASAALDAESVAAVATRAVYAETHLQKLTEVVDRHIRSDQLWTELDRAWCRAHLSGATRQAWEIADLIRSQTGPAAPARNDPLQQRIVDLDAMFGNEFLGPDATIALGQALCGLQITEHVL